MGGAFSNRVALVTGAASGIGQATAEAFAQAGAALMLADVNEAAGASLAQALRDGGSRAVFHRCDVAREADVAGLIGRTRVEFGRLDCAFNGAGIASGRYSVTSCSRDLWDRVIGINLTGVWLCMKHQIPLMLEGGGGAIVNAASIAGLVALPNAASYIAAKHGVIGLTKSAALDYATRNLRVNAVCPGVIDTPMVQNSGAVTPAGREALAAGHPMKRLGTPQEIAAAVLFLCGDGAGFITGHALAADGGWVAQ
jgi:NAD(P)-dependent dehydrogenase (short-subunit alcohol dehydrogenase family)